MPIPNDITFVALDPLPASQLNDLVENDEALADGSALDTNAVGASKLATNAITLGYAQAVTSQSGITTITDLTSLSVTVDVPAGGRYIEIHGSIHMNGSAANLGSLLIREGTTVLGSSRRPNNGTGGWASRVDAWFKGVVSAGSHTYKLSLRLDAGSGSVVAEATDPTVSDIYGPNFIHVKAV